MPAVTDTDRAILHALDLTPARREAVALGMGMSPTRLCQRALVLLDDPGVAAAEPQMVARWRRIRDRQREARRGRH